MKNIYLVLPFGATIKKELEKCEIARKAIERDNDGSGKAYAHAQVMESPLEKYDRENREIWALVTHPETKNVGIQKVSFLWPAFEHSVKEIHKDDKGPPSSYYEIGTIQNIYTDIIGFVNPDPKKDKDGNGQRPFMGFLSQFDYIPDFATVQRQAKDILEAKVNDTSLTKNKKVTLEFMQAAYTKLQTVEKLSKRNAAERKLDQKPLSTPIPRKIETPSQELKP